METLSRMARRLTLSNLVELVRRYWRVMVGIVVAIVIASGAWMGYAWYRAGLEREASASWVLAIAEVRKVDGAKERDELALKKFREIAERHRGTSVAGEALIRLGNRLYDGGKYPEAVETFSRYLDEYSRGPLRVMASIGKAYAEEAKGDLPAAEQTLLGVLGSAPGDPLLGEAELELGRVYEAMKKTDEAAKVYTRVAERYPQSRWAQSASDRLTILKAK
jgi:tetratricopeptide (TPR) repeat protein